MSDNCHCHFVDIEILLSGIGKPVLTDPWQLSVNYTIRVRTIDPPPPPPSAFADPVEESKTEAGPCVLSGIM